MAGSLVDKLRTSLFRFPFPLRGSLVTLFPMNVPFFPRDLGEFGLIERLVGSGCGAGDGVVLGVGDDCAVIDDGAERLLLMTTDLMAEGVHFLSSVEPEGLGDKLLSVNLSDVAAMGGEPRHAVIALALPETLDVSFLDGVYSGLRRRAARHRVTLVGGDTTASRSGLVMAITLTGRVEAGRVLRRDGARVGDRVLVSGTIGDSTAGLALRTKLSGARGRLARADMEYLLARHDTPEPRIDLGRTLAEDGGVTAAIDLSDGLASDLGHVCRRSSKGAVICVDQLPLSDALRRYAQLASVDARAVAACGGEDYELCVTAGPEAVARLQDRATEVGAQLTDVGEIVAGGELCWTTREGARFEPSGGWEHFGSTDLD